MSITISNKSDSPVRVNFWGHLPELDSSPDGSQHYIQFEPNETRVFENSHYFDEEILPRLIVSHGLYVDEATDTVSVIPSVDIQPITNSNEEPKLPATDIPVPAATSNYTTDELSYKSKTELQDIALRLGLSTDGVKTVLIDTIINGQK